MSTRTRWTYGRPAARDARSSETRPAHWHGFAPAVGHRCIARPPPVLQSVLQTEVRAERLWFASGLFCALVRACRCLRDRPVTMRVENCLSGRHFAAAEACRPAVAGASRASASSKRRLEVRYPPRATSPRALTTADRMPVRQSPAADRGIAVPVSGPGIAGGGWWPRAATFPGCALRPPAAVADRDPAPSYPALTGGQARR